MIVYPALLTDMVSSGRKKSNEKFMIDELEVLILG